MKKQQNLLASVEQQLTVGFLTELEILKRAKKKDFELDIIPFLELFDVKEYIDLMMKVKLGLIHHF